MTTLTSTITTMFNRLPIYTRPKEPAIGYPTLTESTNTHLTGQILGLDGRPIPLPSIGGNPYTIGYKIASFKGLPDIPSVGSSLRDDSYGSSEDSEEESLRPPAPLKIKNLSTSTASSSESTLTHKKTESMSSSNSSPRLPPPQQQRKGIHRKPAPPTNPNFSISAKSSAETIRGKSTTPEGSSRRGFGLGNVKEKVSGRRRPVETPSYSSDHHNSDILDPLEAPSPIALAKPPNFVSIDDWLDTREREGLHRRSNTVTTVNTVATRYNDPIRLHIRQSTFEPLPTPHELALSESIPSMPQIPSQYKSAVSKISIPSAPLPTQEVRRPKTPPPQLEEEEEKKPRGHIEQLECEQDKLATRRSDIKREIWDIKQLLPPNPSTHNRSAREDMNKRLAELVQQLADVEKEVHENGMKLHRAWRRRDKKMGIEGPTHLWVSRVRE
ncbi:uncharacterized protein H6S33_006790 [Morchella sextelata]|uniref:uncharacterized protein n=1 Tax=Morchella sextelata TaxID=1174677 RepID=UPI001D04A9BD|nr:uncharacterized protein H6S33_006790 [Morchella sextelata]KAH0604413.1 hypothetical protein H6S33_006790 [Morchella sextelata]